MTSSLVFILGITTITSLLGRSMNQRNKWLVIPKPRLRLQRMEMKLARARLACDDAIAERDYHNLRYVIGFARL